jgi:hypothetical protein
VSFLDNAHAPGLSFPVDQNRGFTTLLKIDPKV